MQAIQFQFDGQTNQMLLPDGEMAMGCAMEIIAEKAYPLRPAHPKIIVDLGAHVGEFTMLAALMWPEAEIHAYEPFGPAVELLHENVRRFPNVQVHPEGVALLDATAPLNLSRMGAICNSLDLTVMDRPSGESVLVKLTDCRKIPQPDCRKIPQPDMLKIDIEGGEPEILRAMNAQGIQRVYVEFHSEADRRKLHELFERTHSLAYARIEKPSRGEMLWEKL